jgi:hypothetical protein
MTVSETIIAQGIANDVAYVGRFASDLTAPEHASFMGVISLCMAPYLSLFVHESYHKLRAGDPALASLLSNDVGAIVARSRHSLKLFEDTHRGIAGQLTYFRDELLPAHSRRFLGNTWLPLARPLEKDLGLFSYAGRLIATTHGTNFHMGIEPYALLAQTGEETRAIYEAYGRYFGHLGGRLDTEGKTFVSYLDPRRFNRRPEDVRASKYYGRVFDGAGNPDLNALLTVFWGMMNFVGSVITAGMDADALEYTVFKIRFLTLYQVLDSLQVLCDEQRQSVTSRSVTCIEQIIGMPDAQIIMVPAAKPFRNTLMHYNLDSRVDQSRVDVSQPLFGLVPIYFPTYDVETFSRLVDRCIAATAEAMDAWAEHK